MNKIFGIDLGTTYSCVAYIDENDKPVVLKNADGQLTTPSVVYFESEDEVVVGDQAKESAKMEPTRAVDFAKNSIGVPGVTWERCGVQRTPEEISSYTLKKIVGDAVETLRAENLLGQDESIKDVVITCPAYFGITEREATKRAGEIAGLNVLDIINEPTAAAISYGISAAGTNKVVMVYDLGGGTFDVTIIKVEPGSIRVVCTGGDHQLGGKNWDERLIDYFASRWCEINSSEEEITENLETYSELKFNAERAKQSLTSKEKAAIPVIHDGVRTRVEITRETFDELTGDLLDRTIMLTRDTLSEAEKKGVSVSDIDTILLVGGSTKMPQVKARVREEFPGIEVMMYDPDEAVAKGAALYAHNKDQTKIILEMVAAEKNVSTEEAERIVAEAAQTGNKRLLGSSVEEKLAQQGLSIAKTINIVNVTSRSFGIVALNEREQRRLFNLICKNDELPASCTEEFFTVAANQTNVLLEVYESLSSDKEVDPEMGKLLGTATMDLPSGLPQGSPLEVSFTLNESGLLEMTARELSANRRCDARFDVKGAISAEEVAAAKSRNLASTVE